MLCHCFFVVVPLSLLFRCDRSRAKLRLLFPSRAAVFSKSVLFQTIELQLWRTTCNTLLLCLTQRSSLHLSFLAVHVLSPLLQGWEYIVLHGPIAPRPHVPDVCLQRCSGRASSLAFPVPRPVPARTPPEEHKSPQKLDRHNNLHNDIS